MTTTLNNAVKKAPALAVLPLVLAAATGHAAHDDTTLRALQVSISDISGNDVTIDVSGSGIDSDSLASIYLGTEALWDGYAAHWSPPAPPAVDWGDGNVLATTQIPFSGTNGTFNGYGLKTFAGQFMHTYAAPGNYTISVFGSNVYANSGSEYSIASGTLSVSSPVLTNTNGSTNSLTGTQPIGILKSVVAAVGGALEPVPALPGLLLGALAALMAWTGVTRLRRA